MKTHYTEADLLETYYTQPGESMPVMLHLAQCEECSARYDRLDRKLREAAVCHPAREEGFWAAQRAAILSRIQHGSSSRPLVGLLPLAAAILVAFVAIGAFFLQRPEPAAVPVPERVEAAVPADPWQEEELQEFGAVVDWETWGAETETDQTNGGHSL